VTGNISASAPTLFMKADSTAARLLAPAIWETASRRVGASRRTRWSTTPEACMARLITSTAATVTNAG
jgi:hypothetical protein